MSVIRRELQRGHHTEVCVSAMTAEEAGTIWDRQADFLLLKGAQQRHKGTQTRFAAISMVITFFGAALSKISRQIIWGFSCWGTKNPINFLSDLVSVKTKHKKKNKKKNKKGEKTSLHHSQDRRRLEKYKLQHDG